jgi:hypothetical protein
MAHLHPRQVRGQRAAFRFVLRCWRVLNRVQGRKLDRDRLEIGLDRLFQQTALQSVPAFAARGKLPALEQRHLVRELLDSELLVLQLVVLPGNALDQAGRKFAQLLRIHRGKLIMHGHARHSATASRNSTASSRHANRRLRTHPPPRQTD